MKKTKEKKGKNTSVVSFSIDKAVEKNLNDAFYFYRKKSKSKFVSELIDLALNEKNFDLTSRNNDVKEKTNENIPDEVYMLWYKSMYTYGIKDISIFDDNWFILNTYSVVIDDKHNDPNEVSHRNELYALEENISVTYNRMIKMHGFFSKYIKGVLENENIKILALKIKSERYKKNDVDRDDNEYCNFRYLITFLDVSENLASKSRYYLDYSSIKMISALSIYENSIKNILKKELGLSPLHYLYWLPIRAYKQYFFFAGVKIRKYSKAEIDDVRKNKVIIVNAI
ncbi:hypothetical protein H2Y54_21365 [Pectobacterium aroidearum]|uniref:hypothetical protein n=1 Tax=Pectobacterium aroidearum TaxID=1201031 RepID=UPI0015EFFE47|nr:hypothetical protein [Pectobacterium aroidearum]MBA5239067.1 hypothetical protein [Pectobacterium aroidearum]